MAKSIAAFSKAMITDEMQLQGKRMEWWRQRALSFSRDEPCTYCGAIMDPETHEDKVDYLLNPELGGLHIKDNLVRACAGCRARKRNRDWLDWCRAPSKSTKAELIARRQVVLSMSANHLLASRETAKTKPYVLTLLQERWGNPRFAVRAALTNESGLIGFTKNTRLPDEAMVLIRLSGGEPTPRNPRIFSIPPASFHALIWQLIDLNAWVRRLDLGPDFPDPTPQDDSISRWHETFTSVGDVHRRREKLPWVHPKKRPPRIEKPMDPRERLHLAGLVALKTGQPVDYEWLARHRESDEAFVAARKKKRDLSWATRHG